MEIDPNTVGAGCGWVGAAAGARLEWLGRAGQGREPRQEVGGWPMVLGREAEGDEEGV